MRTVAEDLGVEIVASDEVLSRLSDDLVQAVERGTHRVGERLVRVFRVSAPPSNYGAKSTSVV